MLRSFYKLYVMLSLSIVVVALALTPTLQYLFVAKFIPESDFTLDATAYQLRDWLAALPESQWQATVQKVRPPIPLIDISLVKRSRLLLGVNQWAALERGQVIPERSGVLVVALPSSDMLLRVAQSPHFPATQTYNMVAWIVVCLLLFGSVVLWLRMHWRDLEQLSRAADRFGEGHLAARSTLSPRSSVAPLARRFDSMAARIETLVTAQNDMINAISHELRTPITRFGFGLALLQGAGNEAERQRHTKALERDVVELDELVGELLSYGSLEQATREPERHLTSLDELIGGVLGSLSLEMELRGVECSTDILRGAEYAVINPRLTARILTNLVKNAIHYCHGHVTIQAERQRDHLVIHVDDDGIGIAPAERETVFEPFHRLDRSRDRNTGGFGLGLAIARRAAVAQGGTLRASSAPMGGARFELLLPTEWRAIRTGITG